MPGFLIQSGFRVQAHTCECGKHGVVVYLDRVERASSSDTGNVHGISVRYESVVPLAYHVLPFPGYYTPEQTQRVEYMGILSSAESLKRWLAKKVLPMAHYRPDDAWGGRFVTQLVAVATGEEDAEKCLKDYLAARKACD